VETGFRNKLILGRAPKILSAPARSLARRLQIERHPAAEPARLFQADRHALDQAVVLNRVWLVGQADEFRFLIDVEPQAIGLGLTPICEEA
jgi:hypothetical protein